MLHNNTIEIEDDAVNNQTKRRRGNDNSVTIFEQIGVPQDVKDNSDDGEVMVIEPTTSVNPDVSVVKPEGRKKAAKFVWPNDLNRMTEAYLLCYVKKSAVTMAVLEACEDFGNNIGVTEQPDRIIQPSIMAPNSVLEIVSNHNDCLQYRINQYNVCYNTIMSTLDMRREIYNNISSFLPIRNDSNEPSGILVPTSWLQSWVTGCPVLGAKDVVMLDAPDSNESSNVINLIDIAEKAPMIAVEDVSSAEFTVSAEGLQAALNVSPIVFSDSYESSSKHMDRGAGAVCRLDACYVCPHGNGIAPDRLKAEFKLISQEAFGAICSTLTNSPDMVLHVPWK